MNDISRIIRGRRAVFPPVFTDQIIDDSLVWELLENANHAPTHRLHQPWRFRVLSGAAKNAFSDVLADTYAAMTPPEAFSEKKQAKQRENPLRSSHVIAIGMEFNPETAPLPEWEEVAAVAMSVQNLWLSAHALGLGGYWSSPPDLIAAPEVRRFLQWTEHQRCLGFFYLGYYQMPPVEARRSPIQDKVLWLK